MSDESKPKRGVCDHPKCPMRGRRHTTYRQCHNVDPHHPHWWNDHTHERERECPGIVDPNCPECKGEGMVGGKTGFSYDVAWACGTCRPSAGRPPWLLRQEAEA